VNSVELWRDYDYYAIERELAVAARRGDFNTVRVSLSYEVWAHNSTLFGNRLQHFVATAFSRGMRTVPVVFDMTQHPNVPRCTLHAVNPDDIEDTRKCWYPSPSYTRSDDIGWWVTEGHAYMDWLIEALPSTLPGMFIWDVVSSPEDYPPPRPDARPEMPRRPAKVPNLANASTVVGTSVSGPGVSYSVAEGEHAWNVHAWTFVQYMSQYMRNHSDVPITVGVHVDNVAKVADWVDVLTFQTSHRLQQPDPPTPHPTHTGSGAIHAQQTANERFWGQMGQPSGSSGYGRGHGEQGFNIKGDGTDMIGGDTHGRARLTPTETAQAVARSRNMPIFNTRTGCADRGWNANPFDQSVESARYNSLPDYMWDHLLRGAADCVKGCNDDTGGCIAASF